jgi:hypothetical protein
MIHGLAGASISNSPSLFSMCPLSIPVIMHIKAAVSQFHPAPFLLSYDKRVLPRTKPNHPNAMLLLTL